MVKKRNYQHQQGGALAITVLMLAVMLIMVITVNKLVMVEQASAANYMDYELAQNYAKAALLNAESMVYKFDLSAGMESPAGTQDITIRRYMVLSKGKYNITANGMKCNMGIAGRAGWCYLPLGLAQNYAQNPRLQPWILTDSRVTKPCNSYTVNQGEIPILDDGNSKFTQIYNTGDNSLCTQPRYIIEPINLDFRGRFESDAANIYGKFTQSNLAEINLYQSQVADNNITINSARLYRITARAFGKNGNTRVTVQEYVLIAQNLDKIQNVTNSVIPVSIRWQ